MVLMVNELIGHVDHCGGCQSSCGSSVAGAEVRLDDVALSDAAPVAELLVGVLLAGAAFVVAPAGAAGNESLSEREAGLAGGCIALISGSLYLSTAVAALEVPD